MKATLLLLALTASVVAAPTVAQMNPPPSTNTQEVTISGVVVSHTADLLVVQTAVGERRIKLSNVTIQPMPLAANAAVTVTYRESNGELFGSTIVLDAAPVKTSPTTMSTAPPVETIPPSTTVAETTTDNWNRGAKTLPATASKLPLLALLGGLSIGGALLLRRVG